MDRESTLSAIVRAGRLWSDPDYPPRAQAVAKTLEVDNRFTLESITFAVNQQVNELRKEKLEKWSEGSATIGGRTIGALVSGNVPFVGLQDFIAVLLLGGSYRAALSSKSPFLLPAFAETISEYSSIKSSFVDGANTERLEKLVETCDALIASGSERTLALVRERCIARAVKHVLFRKSTFSVAVLTGDETIDELEGLAEDAFLHDGLGCRSVAILFAPKNLPVDGFLESAIRFRSVFPAHPDTAKELKTHIALLEATKSPCAYPDDRSFLVSKGEADVFGPGHVRWVTYNDVDVPYKWIEENRERLQLVVAGKGPGDRLMHIVPVVKPGSGQRPSLNWSPDGNSVVEFLSRLGEV